jgi:hypothetical protein
LTVDSDGDGNATNDRDFTLGQLQSNFKITKE